MKLYIEPSEDKGDKRWTRRWEENTFSGKDKEIFYLSCETEKARRKKKKREKRDFEHCHPLFAAAQAKQELGMIVIILYSKHCCLKYPPKSHDVADVPQSGVMHVLKTEEYIELTVHC